MGLCYYGGYVEYIKINGDGYCVPSPFILSVKSGITPLLALPMQGIARRAVPEQQVMGHRALHRGLRCSLGRRCSRG